MEYKYIVIRYGEIGTKGKNKKDFIKCLFKNVKNALNSSSSINVKKDVILIFLL